MVSYWQTIACLLALPILGCPASVVPGSATTVTNTAFKGGPVIEGVARALASPTQSPVGLAATFQIMGLKGESPLQEAVVYLTDPQEGFFRANGKVITTTTNRFGEYRFQGGFAKGVPVIVSAVFAGNRRVVAFTVPDEGARKVDLSTASTITTEYLRDLARHEGRSLGDFDLEKLAGLNVLTQTAMELGKLALPDSSIGRIDDFIHDYAIAVGSNEVGLGDAWAEVLGHRVLASVTVAGSNQNIQADFYRCCQVVRDKFANLLVVDEGNHRIRRIDGKTGLVSTIAGGERGGFAGDGKAATEAQLHAPRAIALDEDGTLFIADLRNCRIRRVDGRTGVITTAVGAPLPDGAGGWQGAFSGDGGQGPTARLYAPRGLVLDANHNLYISDTERGTNSHVIRKLDLVSGLISTVVGSPNTEGAFSGDGGDPIDSRLNYPNQLAIDAQGRLLIADTDNHCIRRVDFVAKSIVTIAGIGGQKGDDPDGKSATRTRLNAPVGLAVAPDGRLFIGERDSGRIRTVGPDGLLRTVAGGGTDLADGDARRQRLLSPHDLWVEPNGNLLVADSRANSLRRIFTRFGI